MVNMSLNILVEAHEVLGKVGKCVANNVGFGFFFFKYFYSKKEVVSYESK